VNLSKLGGANSNFKILNWAFRMFFEAGLLLGELGGNLSLLFPINRLKGVVLMIWDAPGEVFQLFWVKKIVSVKKIKAEVLP